MTAARAAPRLLIVSDLGTADAASHVTRVERAMRGGDPRAIVVGLRDHEAPRAVRLDLGRRLVARLRPAGVRIVVHGDLALAEELGADGLQLGFRSAVDVAVARARLGPSALVSVSAHDRPSLEAAASAGADFATLSPLCASPGKGAPLGVDRFRALRAGVGLPVLALGGIDDGAIELARAAGADGVAAIRAVIGVEDPAPFVRAVFAAFVDDRVGG